jgi:hypothetical protein
VTSGGTHQHQSLFRLWWEVTEFNFVNKPTSFIMSSSNVSQVLLYTRHQEQREQYVYRRPVANARCHFLSYNVDSLVLSLLCKPFLSTMVHPIHDVS